MRVLLSVMAISDASDRHVRGYRARIGRSVALEGADVRSRP
jgi:hypothetical protein